MGVPVLLITPENLLYLLRAVSGNVVDAVDASGEDISGNLVAAVDAVGSLTLLIVPDCVSFLWVLLGVP